MLNEAGSVIRRTVVESGGSRAAHANDPVLGQFEFQAEYRTDFYAEKCGLEEMMYDVTACRSCAAAARRTPFGAAADSARWG